MVILDQRLEVERPLQCHHVVGPTQQLIEQRKFEERHIAGKEPIPERRRVTVSGAAGEVKGAWRGQPTGLTSQGGGDSLAQL